MNERFNEVVKYLVIQKVVRNYAEMCRIVGWKTSTFARMRNGDRNYRVQDVDDFCKHFTMVNRDWILFGTGDMIKQMPSNIQHVNDHATGIQNNGNINVGADVSGLIRQLNEQADTIHNLTEIIKNLTSK